MKELLFAACALAAMCGMAACDRPNFLDLVGTGYHTNNWYAMNLTADSDKKFLQFSNNDRFLLSPRYPAPIRKVVLSVRASSASVTRTMRIRPMFDGAEDSADKEEWAVANPGTAFSPFVFDFQASENVDAVRFCVDGGSGSFHVNGILVLYGERDADEDVALREFARQLPTPENLRVETFTANSLSLAADAVADAAGYRFAVARLEGMPRTECREDFVAAPALSSGWTYGATNGVALGLYTGSGYYDSKTAKDKSALKIEPKGSDGSQVEILSPLVGERITEYSFASRASKSDNPWTVAVYGRSSGAADWQVLSGPVALSGSLDFSTDALPADVDVRQVKLVLAAASASANAALDSLSIVYGGNEKRTVVLSGEAVSTMPTCSLVGLEADARYVYKVQAVADSSAETPCRDSSWSEEQVVDLAWASIEVTPPTDVAWEMDGAKMTVRWTAVAGAGHYLVDVVPADDSEHPVVTAAKATGTSLAVTVPSVGEYAVTVTAVSLGGLSAATSETLVGEVELAAMGAVALKAVDRQEVEASWANVPLAEGYQVKLVSADATVESVRTTESKVTFRNLDPNGRYAVTVVPLPSEGEALGATSPIVDLSKERFRETGALPLSKVEGGAYVECFDSLSNVSAKVETRSLPLDYWQLDKGAGEAEAILYSAKATFTTGGIYVLSDEERTPSSYMLGTLATGTFGCSVGIAFLNDLRGSVGIGKLSFDSVQRTFKSVPKGYVLEYLLTTGTTDIDAEGVWRSLEIPKTAPYVAGDAEAGSEYRQTVVVEDGLPKKIPIGGVLILRWRHEKGASGPAMGIDNVRLEVDTTVKGFGIVVR